ncbi:hypothetical protein [Paraflavitalea pollutisoli]|uniref:hypothetical protein n=1 Tax=Paraflavitalea pollutisoli TaxID=3034143 RepID=UPI0023EBBF73|nr:hypothetical protein [Paraflavitalea sp. H1-2-19X]
MSKFRDKADSFADKNGPSDASKAGKSTEATKEKEPRTKEQNKELKDDHQKNGNDITKVPVPNKTDAEKYTPKPKPGNNLKL